MLDKEYVRQKLIDNPDKTIETLKFFEFHDLCLHDNHLRCALPGRNDNTSVAVDLDTLYCNIFAPPAYSGDLFGMLLHWNEHFRDGYKWNFPKILRIIDEKILKTDSIDKLLYQQQNKVNAKPEEYRHDVSKADTKETIEYDISYLNKYVRLPHIKLTSEGILAFVQDKYMICYDATQKRILIPHFKYDDKTKIVDLKGRTTIDEYELLGIPKYVYYIGGYQKSKNLYAFSHNIEAIRENRRIIIFEAEKSVMKLESLNIYPPISVALGGSSLSDWQADLIGNLSKEIEGFEVVLCMDKDVEEEHILKICSKLNDFGCDFVSYVIDDMGLLDTKDAPIDKGYCRWTRLYATKKRAF